MHIYIYTTVHTCISVYVHMIFSLHSSLAHLITAHITLGVDLLSNLFWHFLRVVPRARRRQNPFHPDLLLRTSVTASPGVDAQVKPSAGANTGAGDLSAPCLLLLCAMPLSGHAGQFRTSRSHKGTHCIFRKSSRPSRVNRPLFDLPCQNENEKTVFYFGTLDVPKVMSKKKKKQNLQLGCPALQWKTRLLPVMPWSEAGSEQHACCSWRRNMPHSIGSQ